MTNVVGALKKARTATDKAYSLLMKMVNSLAMVFGDDDYANFIDYMNTEIMQYKREVLRQKANNSGTDSGTDKSDNENISNGDDPTPETPEIPGTGGNTGNDRDDFV